MERKEFLNKQIYDIIENQLKENDPPEIKIAYDNLRKQGFDDESIKVMFAHCVSVELFRIFKYREPFNNERYVKNLLALPREPEE